MPRMMERCYPCRWNAGLMAVGYGLLIAGVILLFACIPGWVWLALIGLVLIILGVALLKVSKAWR